MTLIEFLTILTAIISLAVSLWAAFRTNQIAKDEIRLSKRTELHSIMHSIEQVLIDKPELALIFRSEKDHQIKFETPSIPIQEAYVFMHLNLFELAFSLFKETRQLNKKETEIATAWDSTIENFFDNCIPAEKVWQEFKSTYYKSFREHVDRLLQKPEGNPGNIP